MCACLNMRQGDVNEDDDDVNGDDNGRPHHMTDMYFRDLLGGECAQHIWWRKCWTFCRDKMKNKNESKQTKKKHPWNIHTKYMGVFLSLRMNLTKLN